MAGGKHLIRVVKDFNGESDDELTVTKGEIVQFIAKTEQYWFKVWQNGREGKLPISSCIEINARDLVALRIVREQQAIFIARYDFIEGNKEDLAFAAKEMLIGLREVNNDWWYGCRFDSVYVQENRVLVDSKNCGIFPLSYVWKAREELLPDYIFSASGTEIIYPRMQSTSETSTDQGQTTHLPASQNPSNMNDKKYLFHVKVVTKLDKQFEEEMSLPTLGEVLGVLDDSDRHFYRGEALDRTRHGLFPKKFVEVVQRPADGEQDGATDDDDDDSSACPSPLPPTEPPPTPSFSSNITYDGKHISFQNSSIDRQDSLDQEPPSYENVMSQGYNNEQYNVAAYAKVLYDYAAQQSDELSLRENEIVHLLRHVDAGWVEGEINGQIGLVPKNYISIIVDCGYDHLQAAGGGAGAPSNETTIEPIEEFFPPNTRAKALYNFDGERDKDLSLREGEILTLVRKFPNSDWIEAMNANEVYGFVHKTFVETIDSNVDLNADMSRFYTNIDDIAGGADNTKTVDKSKTDDHKKDVHLDQPSTSKQQASEYIRSSLSPKRPAPAAPIRRAVLNFNEFVYNEKLEHINGPAAASRGETSTSQPPTTPATSEEEVKTKETVLKNQRQCVITELIQTEKDYCHAMSVCVRAFERHEEQAERVGFNVEKMFANLKQVISVSRHLLKLFDNYAYNRAYADQRVGICFLELRTSLEEAYTVYCRSHDAINAQFKAYDATTPIRLFIQERLHEIQSQTNCFNISSILIKPVQRILKYPLLLNELIKCTEVEHVDMKQLQLSLQMITNIATNINEHKRRQELIAKYCTKGGDPTLGEKLKSINMHTVMKKGNRLKHRFLSTLTFSHGDVKDEVFDSLFHKFQTTEKLISSFMHNVKSFNKHLDDCFGQSLVVIEAMSKYLDNKHDQHNEVEVLRSVQRTIFEKHFRQFNSTCEKDVLGVLKKLTQRFTIPAKLIQKRKDKLIDYESSLKSTKVNTDEAKRTFDALNQQLIDELPQLIQASTSIFAICLETFLIAYRKMSTLNTKIYLDRMNNLPLVKNVSFAYYDDVEEGFRVKHNLILDQMLKESSLLHASAFPNANVALTKATNATTSTLARLTSNRKGKDTWRNSMPVNKISAGGGQSVNEVVKKQTEAHRNELESRYEATSLFQANSNYSPSDVMDIGVEKGDIVGVIKRRDPMGLDHRWFVDKGNGIKGFLPRSILAAYTSVWSILKSEPSTSASVLTPRTPTSAEALHQPAEMESPPRYDQVPTEEDNERYDSVPIESSISLLSFEEPDGYQLSRSSNRSSVRSTYDNIASLFDPLVAPPASPTPKVSQQPNVEYRHAAYAFKGADNVQLSMEVGQRVKVICKSDTKGNAEWWMVENEQGRQGYVPANYLKM